MADRAVVRQGFVVSLGLGAVLALVAMGPGPDADGSNAAPRPATQGKAAPSEVPIESRPYKIRAWLALDPHARVDARGREALVSGWRRMVSRFVGAPWDLEIVDGDGPLATTSLDDVTPEMVIPEAKGFDKAWLIRVEPEGGGLAFAGREFDAATAQIGLLGRRSAPVPADSPRALLQLCLDIFAPSAEIAEGVSGKQKLRVQGALLPAADPIGRVAAVGSIFRPTRIFYKPDGGIQLVTPIKKTYLRVESMTNGVATCAIETAFRNPFTTKTVGKAKMVAVGLKPAWIPTKIRFLLSAADSPAIPGTKPEPRPAAGYDVIAIPQPSGSPRPVGTTDREGRIVLEPGFSDGLVNLQLVAAGVEPLIEFPVMPGEQVEENVIGNVDAMPVTVKAETEINGLRDEIVDLIAVRHRLESRLKARAEADTPDWEDVKRLLGEFRMLPARDLYSNRLEKLDADLNAEQQQDKRRRIRSRTVQRLFDDTQALMDRYLQDEDFEAYARALDEYNKESSATKGATKALPKAPTIAMSKAANTPDAAGLIQFAPPGAGFRVDMPRTPTSSSARTSDGTSDITTYRAEDPARGTFAVESWDYPVALTPDDLPRVLDSERARLAASVPNGRLTKEGPITVDGRPGKEVEFEIPGARNAPTEGMVCRIAVDNSRIFVASYRGPQKEAQGKTAAEFFASFHLTRGGSAARGDGGGSAAGGNATAPPAHAPPAGKAKPPSPASRPSNPNGKNANPF